MKLKKLSMFYHQNIINHSFIDINKIYDLQSSKKLHHEMSETRKDPNSANTTTGGTKIVSTFSIFRDSSIGSMSLLIQTPVAFSYPNLNDYIYSNLSYLH